MIRLRQVGRSRFLRRRLYEIEYDTPEGETTAVRTTMPVFVVEDHVGVGEAVPLVHAAADLWDKGSAEWTSMATWEYRK